MRQQMGNWRRLLDTLPDAVVTVAGDYRIDFASEAAIRMFGGGIAGQDVRSLLSKGDVGDIADMLDTVMRASETAAQAKRMTVRVEGKRPIICDVVIIAVDNTNSRQALVLFRDISAQVQLDEERAERGRELERLVRIRTAEAAAAADRFRGAVAASPDAFVVIDETGIIRFVSDQFGLDYPTIHIVEGDTVMEVTARLSAAWPQIRNTSLWTWLSNPSGSIDICTPTRRWVRLAAATGQTGQVVIVQTDITAYIRQTAESRRQARRLSAALTVQERFVGMVSHEMRSPLAVIDSTAQTILRHYDRLPADDILRRMTDMRGQVARMTTMVDATLTSARLDDGRLPLAWERIDPGEIVEDVARESVTIHSGRRIVAKITGTVCAIAGDKMLIRQLIENVVSNAIKYSNDGDVDIAYWDGDAGVHIAVSDQGAGIPTGEIPLIFDRYYRASNAGSVRGASGTGIGLYVVRELVKLHGGRIAAESTVGKGTTFRIWLPRSDDICGECRLIADPSSCPKR